MKPVFAKLTRGTMRAVAAGLLIGMTSPAIPNAVAAPSAGNVTSVRIDITMSAFAPKEVTVAPGTQVVWINHDQMPHTATSVDKRFDSRALDTDDQYTTTFNEEGDYAYYCSVHPFMTGIVHVRKKR